MLEFFTRINGESACVDEDGPKNWNIHGADQCEDCGSDEDYHLEFTDDGAIPTHIVCACGATYPLR